MQQRQLRLGDILDDYCPRERRVTNHAVVAMIGDDVKQTRCTTCDADHEYKHAKVPRQRRKADTPAALYAQVAAAAPKRVAHDPHADAEPPEDMAAPVPMAAQQQPEADEADARAPEVADESVEATGQDEELAAGGEFESVHRPLIRATLPRHEGQQPTQRQAPDFTIRQPAGRPGRFRPRNARGGGQPFGGSNGNRSGGGPGNFGQSMRGGAPRQFGGRPQPGNSGGRPGRHRHQGPPPGKRSK